MKLYTIFLTFPIYFLALIFGACGGTESQTKERVLSEDTPNLSQKGASVVITMEGKTYTMEQADLNPQTELDFENDKLQFVIYTNDSRVTINLNLIQTGLVDAGPKTYSIPEANQPNIRVDLSFYNQDRDASRINKRVVFKKGEVTIEKLSQTELHLTFKGEGSGMTESGDLFPIEGSIHINF